MSICIIFEDVDHPKLHYLRLDQQLVKFETFISKTDRHRPDDWMLLLDKTAGPTSGSIVGCGFFQNHGLPKTRSLLSRGPGRIRMQTSSKYMRLRLELKLIGTSLHLNAEFRINS